MFSLISQRDLRYKLHLFIYLLTYFCVLWWAHSNAVVAELRGQVAEVFSALWVLGVTQAIRLGSKHLCPLSHLTIPRVK